MFCEHCGHKMEEGSVFCKKCGKNPNNSWHTTPSVTIKCGNCDYVGHPTKARRVFSVICAWLCIFFAPLITVIYFVVTNRYKCPKCGSTFVGIKSKGGSFVGQRGGKSILMKIVWVIVGIMLIGLVSSVILAALNSAREKGAGSDTRSEQSAWTTYNSVADKFSVLLPGYPTIEKDSDETDTGIGFTYNTYSSKLDSVTYAVISYTYAEELDISDENKFMEGMLNGLTNGVDGTLISSNFLYRNSRKNLNFLVKDNEGYYYRGSIVVHGQAPYLLLAHYPVGTDVDSDYQKFVTSFFIR